MADCAKALSCAKLSLSMNNYFGIRQYQSHRIWTNMACGMCVMNRYEPGLEDIFEDHVNQVFWHTEEELLALIGEYLKYDDMRERVATVARQCILNGHTFDHRIRLLGKILKGKKSGIKWDQRV